MPSLREENPVGEAESRRVPDCSVRFPALDFWTASACPGAASTRAPRLHQPVGYCQEVPASAVDSLAPRDRIHDSSCIANHLRTGTCGRVCIQSLLLSDGAAPRFVRDVGFAWWSLAPHSKKTWVSRIFLELPGSRYTHRRGPGALAGLPLLQVLPSANASS